MTRWHRYWFEDGGRHAAAMVRIAIAVAVLICLKRLSGLSMLVAPEELYRPVGVWMVLGKTPPPAVLIDLLWVAAWGGTIAMLLGVYTRTATAISFVAAVALAAVSFSARATWSHQYNVVFIAQLAFLGARGGDVFSVDAWLRRRRGRPAIDEPGGYQWSLRLVQLAVALMFTSACFYKLLHGHFTLRWALSDNLRHQLMMHYDLASLERPPIVDWILADVWRYRTVAVLNIVTQFAPILAVVFTRRAWVRAAAGGAFVIEVLALGVVVQLWNPAWLPLVAVFIDWDAVFAWARRRLGRAALPAAAIASSDRRPSRARRIFIGVFVGYELLTALVPTVDQRLNTFPFSGFPMFAKIRVRPPLDEHRPFSVAADHVQSIDVPVHARAQRWLDNHHRGIFRDRDPARVRAKLQVILTKAPGRYPELPLVGVRHYLAIFEVAAYPAPARFERHLVGITGELRADGQFRSLLGTVTPSSTGLTVRLRPIGLDPRGARFVYYRDDVPVPIDVVATPAGDDTYELPPIAGPYYLVAVVDGVPWLVR